MTKKLNALESLYSINVLLDRVFYEEEDLDEVAPFCRFELRKIRRIFKSHPFADEISEMIDTAIAFSDSLESFGYAIDDLQVAIECL